jgi:hypothetical protein
MYNATGNVLVRGIPMVLGIDNFRFVFGRVAQTCRHNPLHPAPQKLPYMSIGSLIPGRPLQLSDRLRHFHTMYKFPHSLSYTLSVDRYSRSKDNRHSYHLCKQCIPACSGHRDPASSQHSKPKEQLLHQSPQKFET